MNGEKQGRKKAMTFTMITENRKGKLIADKQLLTDEVMRILARFNNLNGNTFNQEDVVCAIGDLQDELEDECSAEDFNLCSAIFINAKNYLIRDKKALYRELDLMNVDIHEERGTWVPKHSLNFILYFLNGEVFI